MSESSANAPDHAEVLFHPPVLLLAAIAVGLGAHALAPLGAGPAGLRPLGPAATAAALGLFAWAIVTFRRRGGSIPTHEPTDVIVSAGPYRFTRNPIYLSFIVLQLGLALWLGNGWLLLTAGVSALLLRVGVIAREERYLSRKFGESYGEYTRRVRRWI